MFLPRCITELVADQLVGGEFVGDAQQGLGHAHQQHAFFGAEVVLAHKGLHQFGVGRTHAGALHQRFGGGLHPGLHLGGQGGRDEQFGEVFGLVAGIGRGEFLARRSGGGGQFGAQDRLHAQGPGAARKAASVPGTLGARNPLFAGGRGGSPAAGAFTHSALLAPHKAVAVDCVTLSPSR